MSKQRKSAYGAPAEEKEVLITIDRRVLFGGALLVVLAVALAGGVWWGRRGDTASVAVATSSETGGPTNLAATVPTTDPAQLQQDLAEAGMPNSVVVVTPNAPVAPEENPFHAQVTPAVPSDQSIAPVVKPDNPGEVPLQQASPGQGQDPGEDISTLLPKDPKGDKWTPDVIAGMPDPNLSEQDSAGRGVQPVRIETVSAPLEGPRIGLSDLNEQFTYNFGIVPVRDIASHDFVAKNVGDQDLIISRVYAGCGCTATVFGGVKIQADGFLPAPVTLKPGESEPFTVEFDPRAEGVTIAQSKYIQIYSNDPTRYLFDDNEPLSHEVRMRIVVMPQ